jgi:hypothetical protein
LHLRRQDESSGGAPNKGEPWLRCSKNGTCQSPTTHSLIHILTTGGAGAPGAKPKPVLDLSVLEKAKKALALQKELKEKLKRLQVIG